MSFTRFNIVFVALTSGSLGFDINDDTMVCVDEVVVRIDHVSKVLQRNLVMTSPSAHESTIPRTGMDEAITGMHCSLKHEEFKATASRLSANRAVKLGSNSSSGPP